LFVKVIVSLRYRIQQSKAQINNLRANDSSNSNLSNIRRLVYQTSPNKMKIAKQTVPKLFHNNIPVNFVFLHLPFCRIGRCYFYFVLLLYLKKIYNHVIVIK